MMPLLISPEVSRALGGVRIMVGPKRMYDLFDALSNAHAKAGDAATVDDLAEPWRSMTQELLDGGSAAKGDVVGHQFHGNQWTQGGGSNSSSGNGSQSFDDLQASFVGDLMIEPNTQEGLEHAQGIWAGSFEDCTAIQNATDDMINGSNPQASGQYDGQAVFCARALNDAMTGGNGHFQTSDALLRGIADPTGAIAARFEVGKSVDWNIAAFTTDPNLANNFATFDNGLLLKTEGRVQGAVISSDEDGWSYDERVVGGSFEVVSKETNSDGQTVVTIRQTHNVPRIY
jgi:hypothetical protein